MLKTKHLISLVFVGAFAGASAACDGDSGPDNLEPPIVASEAAYTNQNPYTVEGSGEPGAVIEIRGGAEAVASGVVNGDGEFSVAVQLKANEENRLLLSQQDGGVESTIAEYTITHDDIAPDNAVLEPVATPTRRKSVALEGSAEAGATIVVTGGLEETTSLVDDEGRFVAVADLNVEVADITNNELSVEVVDLAGNRSGATDLSIVHNPALPIEAPIIDDLATHTSASTLTVSGTTEPDLEVQIVGSSVTDVVADELGRFSASITLDENTNNRFSAFGIVSALGISSPAAKFSVIHDNIAPASPTLNPLASPTGATVISVSGTTEAFATINIDGAAAPAMVVADETGDFVAEVTLNENMDNLLEITTSDQAGNASSVTEVLITQDTSLDDPVIVDSTASFTNQSPITLTGTGSPNSTIEIDGGLAQATTTTDGSGAFSVSVNLNLNARNDLVARHSGGVTETNVTVTHDSLPPAEPSVNSVASPTNKTQINLTGTSEPFASINVTGGVQPANGTADGNGQWIVPVTIAEDQTTELSATATDRAGNISLTSATVSVTHSSAVADAPVVDDENPPPTNQATHLVTGQVTDPGPGITIHISGGAAPAAGQIDETSGSFAVEVTLNANADNTLSVTSLEGDIESPATTVSITHDDLPPADVDEGSVVVGTPGGLGCAIRGPTNVNGAAGAALEAVEVEIVNATASGITSSANVAADGSFAGSINACAGDILRLTGVDAAGNTSVNFAEVTVPN